jgi:hypothetical protein
VASSRTELSVPATGALLTLLAEGRPLTNAQLAEAGAPRLTGETRRRLNEAKLVESTRVGRGFTHEITDDGVARCRDLLTAPTPPRAGSLGGALFAVLRGLGRTGIPLAEIFPSRPAEVSVEDRIRGAYRELATYEGEFVHLHPLRVRLADLDRAALDEVLVRLAEVRGVHFSAEPDTGSLSADERAAAVRLGGEDRHMIMVEGR